MFLELYVENFALIDRLRLRLGEGLNILTGETGAGKSILIDAVETVLGGRASVDFIRSGEEKALVEVLFDVSGLPGARGLLEEWGLATDEGVLLLGREIGRGGRTTSRINGRVATASMIREIGQYLIDIHGQHEHQSLLRPEKHLDLLDRFGGVEVLEAGERVGNLYRRWKEADRKLQELVGDQRDRARRLDLNRFQVEEIDRARLVAGEEESLAEERKLLANAERLAEIAGECYSLLYEGSDRQGSACDLIGRATSALAEACRFDGDLQATMDGLQQALYQVEDAARELYRYREKVQCDPGRLMEVEARLDLLSQLKRKYGDSVSEILAYRAQAAAELERLENSEELAAQLAAEREAIRAELAREAAGLSSLRRTQAGILAERVAAELADLNMPGAQFEVGFRWEEDSEGVLVGDRTLAVGPRGIDRVEFIFSANPGDSPRPLSRIASGGEMARVMLALKSVLAEADEVPTLIFDEIDAGIGGRAAEAVGEKMAYIAGRRQVLCITHLAPIASLADRHYLIEKRVQGERTVTDVDVVEGDARVAEIARMIGGSGLGRVTQEHAARMLERGQQRRRELREP